MWETLRTGDEPLSHDRPCPRCGHGMHTFLACGDGCSCEPASTPDPQHRAA